MKTDFSDQPSSTFSDLVRRRTSCRGYRPDPVPRAHLEKMIEAAVWAPSACNRQPWRFAVVTRPETRTRVFEEGILPGMTTQWMRNAPVVIILGIMRSLITHRLAPRISGVPYAWVDIGIAGEHLVLQATELGLGTCWIGWIAPSRIRAVIGWPGTIQPAVLFTVGWPAPDSSPPERARLPQSETVQWRE